MAYSKTNWVNDTTPINATNLNKIEQGIFDNDDKIGDLTLLNTTNQGNLVNAVNEVFTKTETESTYYYNNELRQIKNLSIQTGQIAVTTGTSLTTTNVTFPKAFTSTPIVLVSVSGTAGYMDRFGSSNITTTGFTLQARHSNDNTTVYYRYLAIGEA